MAVDTLINITKDEIEFARMTTLIKSELDWRSIKADIERKTADFERKKADIERKTADIERKTADFERKTADAENKGRNEATLENARKMKAMGFLTEQIQAVTGLSMETIAQL